VSGYVTLHAFTVSVEPFPFSGLDERFPLAGLIQGNDEAFYGTTSGNNFNTYANGGSYKGSVFKLWPPETPDIISVTAANNSAEVGFFGEGGAHYQVLCSTDLITWSLRDTIAMTAAGTYTYPDGMAALRFRQPITALHGFGDPTHLSFVKKQPLELSSAARISL
jgi:hypothetical protein